VTWDGIPERFHATRLQGRKMALDVARVLVDKGLPVQMEEDVEAPEGMTPREAAETFIDERDIVVGRRLIEGDLIEVKSSSYAFTDDYWPFREAFVTSKGRWERYPFKAFAFVLISQQTGAMRVIFPDRTEEWYPKTVKNSTRENRAMEVMCAPLSHLQPIEVLLDALDNR